MPLLCVLWACAVDGILRWLESPADIGLRITARSRYAIMLLAMMMFAFSMEGQREVRLLLSRAAPQDVLSYAAEPDWTPAVGVLRPLAVKAERVVTSNSMKSLYYLGRYDYELNASIVAETDTRTDFGRDERTGRKAIGSAAAVSSVIDATGTTLVVLENRKLDSDVGVPAAAHAVIAAACEAVNLPADLAVSAWQCTR
jgi:hypothetical protein